MNQVSEQLKLQYRAGRWRRIRAIIKKEMYQIVRDPSNIIVSVVYPLLLLFLYGFGVSLDLNHIRLGVVMEDTAPDAQSFTLSLSKSRFFDVKIARDRRELTDDLLAGRIRGMVVIPSYFSAFRDRPSNIAPILIISDGSEPNTATFLTNYVQLAFRNWLDEEAVSTNLQGLPLVSTEPRFWYNEELESRRFLIPGSLALIMTLIGTLLTALVISREWEMGTMESLMSTPIGIVELLLGKLIPYFFLGMLSMAICVVFAVLFYNIPLRGSVLLLALVTAFFLVTALGIGLLISTVFKNQIEASQVSMVTAFLPAFILSGFIFEILSMPTAIRFITYLVPARYFVTLLQSLFLVGNVWSLIVYNSIPLLIFGALVFAWTARITVKRLD